MDCPHPLTNQRDHKTIMKYYTLSLLVTLLATQSQAFVVATPSRSSSSLHSKLDQAGETVKEGIHSAKDLGVNAVDASVDGLQSGAEKVQEGAQSVQDTSEGLWEKTKNVAGGVKETVVDVAGTTKDVVVDAAKGTTNVVRNTVVGAADKVQDAASAVKNAWTK